MIFLLAKTVEGYESQQCQNTSCNKIRQQIKSKLFFDQRAGVFLLTCAPWRQCVPLHSCYVQVYGKREGGAKVKSVMKIPPPHQAH